jgi:DNA-binding transcriptional LysR family regulator
METNAGRYELLRERITMTSDQIVYFLTVEKHMNFSYAAEELNMSQPALSRQIQALETEISATLFNRNSRNITLTPAGMEFMAHAKKATEDYQNMILAMKHFSDKSRNKLIFTSLPIMSIYRLTQMVVEFRRTRSDIRIAINEEDAKSVLASLESYRADVAYYIYDNMKRSGFKVFPVNEEEMVLIVGRKTIWQKKTRSAFGRPPMRNTCS